MVLRRARHTDQWDRGPGSSLASSWSKMRTWASWPDRGVSDSPKADRSWLWPVGPRAGVGVGERPAAPEGRRDGGPHHSMRLVHVLPSAAGVPRQWRYARRSALRRARGVSSCGWHANTARWFVIGQGITSVRNTPAVRDWCVSGETAGWATRDPAAGGWIPGCCH